MTVALVLAFIVTPLVELYVLLRVGDAIGLAPALILLLAVSLAGGALVRREGARAWLAVQQALQEGRLPGREVADGALVLLGGALLLTPGFVTDALGLLTLLPVSRPLGRRLLLRLVGRRAAARAARGRGPRVVDAEVLRTQTDRAPGEGTRSGGELY